MQVNNTAANSVARLYSQQAISIDDVAARGAQRSAPERPRTDSVSMSSMRSEVMRTQAAAAAQPDVRAERVAALKAAIATGSYQPDNRALAQQLLG